MDNYVYFKRDVVCPMVENRIFAHFVSCSVSKITSILGYVQKGGHWFMDIVKIGKFLQTLRKENGFTQEQLAERMGVSRRTISRWETGSNMPDMDILMELSDLYTVDLREILNGERKSEHMNEELKETVLQVADYNNEEKARLLQRMHWLFIVGLIGFITFLVITLFGLDNTKTYEGIGSFGLGIAFGMMILGVIFTSKYVAKIREFKLRLLTKFQRVN